MPAKKDFTRADNAIDKLFTAASSQSQAQAPQDAADRQAAANTADAGAQKPPNRSKQYEQRGKREVRFGLMFDEKLKEDITHLAMASGKKSVNDFIITILLDHLGRDENQEKLKRYRELLGGA